MVEDDSESEKRLSEKKLRSEEKGPLRKENKKKIQKLSEKKKCEFPKE